MQVYLFFHQFELFFLVGRGQGLGLDIVLPPTPRQPPPVWTSAAPLLLLRPVVPLRHYSGPCPPFLMALARVAGSRVAS